MSSNQRLIIEEGIKHGIFTEEEAEMRLIYGQDIPLHTFSGWQALGKAPRKGEHGIPTKLWKLSKSRAGEDAKSQFMLVTSYLFREDQVEDIVG